MVPLEIVTYIRTADYPEDAVIACIPWNSHFTDLRVVLSNKAADEYKDIDILVSQINGLISPRY